MAKLLFSFLQGSGQVRGQPRSTQAGQPQGQGQQPSDVSNGPQASPAAQAAQGDFTTEVSVEVPSNFTSLEVLL